MSYSDTATVESVDIETLDLSTDDTIPVERTFLGQITVDQKEPGKFGPQWHFAVKPLSFTLNSESGAFHNWPAIKFSDKTGELVTQGEYGKVVSAVRQVFGKHKIGEGELVGLTGHFVLRKLEYGKDKITGELIAGKRDSLIAVRAATPEEIASAGVAPGTPSAPLYSQEDITALVGIMGGKTVTEYTKGIGRRTDLSPEIKNALMNGSAYTEMAKLGLVTLVNGVVTVN